jgi:two-component system cell cycle sensor histidine kinase/response regulator CckA
MVAARDGKLILRHQARYRLLFERNLAGVYRSTPDGRILECNDAFARIFGYADATEASAVPAVEFHETAANREAFVERLRARGSLQNYEVLARRKDGSAVWILENVVLSDDERQEVIEGTIIDVTDRKRAERALAESEARYRSIFDFATVGIYQAREDGSLTTVNRTLSRLLGYDSPEELQRLPLEAVSFDAARIAAEGRETVQWKKKDGTPVWVEIERHAVRDAEGRTLYLEGFVHDVTERRRAEEVRSDLEKQLAQAQKMEAIGQLAGGIAHDFNNLLTAIAGYSDLLIGSLSPDDPRRPHAEEIQRAGDRAASLTRQLLAFSRRQLLEPKVLDLNDVVGNMERMLQRVIGEHIRFRTKKSPDLGRVRADPGQIEQAILNLVVNARDAMRGGGELTIETAPFSSGEDPAGDV